MHQFYNRLPIVLRNIVIEYIPREVQWLANGELKPEDTESLKFLIDFGMYYEVEKYLFNNNIISHVFKYTVYQGDIHQLNIVYKYLKSLDQCTNLRMAYDIMIHSGDNIIEILEWALKNRILVPTALYGTYSYAVKSDNPRVIEVLDWLLEHKFAYNKDVFIIAASSSSKHIIKILDWLKERDFPRDPEKMIMSRRLLFHDNFESPVTQWLMQQIFC